MCDSNRNLEEILVHGAIGGMGINYDALNAWARSYFNLTDDSWNPWGAGDPNDKSRPYGKTINAIFLIGYALSDNHDLQWHSLEDYESLACARDNRFHDDRYHRIIRYNGSSEATSHWGGLGTQRTDLHCPLFESGSISNFASHRAAVMIHEAWHHWMDDHNFNANHGSGGASPWPQADNYYFHTVSVFEFGHLHGWSYGPPVQFHTPYQIEAEFFADLAEMSRSDVPTIVTQTARSHGNILLDNAFINPAPYSIGDPRPW